MSVITAIETQKRRENRRSIFVDGEFIAGAHEEVILALGLAVGQVFDRERLVELVRAETHRKALESALRLISYRNRSVTELRKRLLGNDFPEETVEEVVEQLSDMGFLDDRKFSTDWVKSRTAAKPMGKTRLAWELRSKGVDAPIVEESLADIDEDKDYELALSLAVHKVQKADREDPSFKNRLGSFLRRRGFSWDVITRVFEEIGSGEPDSD
jgi:regulatory protein